MHMDMCVTFYAFRWKIDNFFGEKEHGRLRTMIEEIVDTCIYVSITLRTAYLHVLCDTAEMGL